MNTTKTKTKTTHTPGPWTNRTAGDSTPNCGTQIYHMTDLKNTVTRRAVNATVFECGTKRIIVTLHPSKGSQPEQVGIRLERTRIEFRVNLTTLYWQAVTGESAARSRAFAQQKLEVRLAKAQSNKDNSKNKWKS